MVLDLFSGAALNRSGSAGRRRTTAAAASRSASAARRPSTTHTYAAGTRRASVGVHDAGSAVSEEDRKLFNNCVAQVQRHLKAHADSPSTLHTLASYYTKTTPVIEERPFCVSLSYATFLFHMQMTRISVAEVELYVQLITSVLSQIDEDAQLRHPFVQQVLRDHVFGLPSPTCRGAAHSLVLLPPQQYRGFATMTTTLIALDVVPLQLVYQLQDRLETYCECTSPLVANRALALLVQTVSQVRMDEQVTALQYVLKTKPAKMNVDFLLACYERLKRAVTDPAHGPSFARALSIHCSELFLRFRSPIRREYVERFLYPSLCHNDMAAFLELPATRQHLTKELLSQCTPEMGTMNPFYMCLCAVLQSSFDNETDGALATVTLIHCRMPHAAYFAATLAIDAHMSVSMFAKVMIALARGAGMAMTGRETPDEVATAINEKRTSVYNVLFLLREVVRSCSVTASRRATDMLKALRVAVPPKTIEALGKLANEAFEEVSDVTLDPQLLCAELAMVLHQEHIGEAMDSAVEYFRDVTSRCPYCNAARSTSLLCPVNGTVHVSGQSSVTRVLSTLAECAGTRAVEEKLIAYLREPVLQMESAVHYLIYHIIAHGGQHRATLFVAAEPYVRSTLLALVSADRSAARGLVSSAQKANVLMLHVKLVTLLASSIDPSYLESILKVFAELKLRNNHDALALWYMGNVLLRYCRGNLELLPTDPQESNYCVAYPGCAPTSATTADNAQLVLKLLHRAHAFSPEMHKLVGCCVCKLIQDFNMQAPNICSTLLSPFGFLPVGLESLNTFALPAGAGSTFWTFFLQQMRSSAPARTAFMATLTKSMSRRFRISSPVEALASTGAEPTGHLFAIMVYEAMKRNPPLARVLLYMLSQWVRQSDHAPGKFACLLYVCVQLVMVVADRADGPAAVERAAETPQDRQQFDDAVKKAARVLKTQQTRLDRLAPAVRRENLEFFYLLRRLRRRVRYAVAAASGERLPSEEEDVEESAEEAAAGWWRPGERSGARDSTGDGTVAMQALQNAADDSVFDDYVEAEEGEEAGAPVEDDTGYDVDATRDTQATSSMHIDAGDRDDGVPGRMRPLPQGLTGILRSSAPKIPQGTTSALSHETVDVDHNDDFVEEPRRGQKGDGVAEPARTRTRSISRGVQTDDESDEAELQGHKGMKQSTADALTSLSVSSAQRSVGTSPIQPSRTQRSQHPHPRDPFPTPSSSSSLFQQKRSHTRPPEDEEEETSSSARGSFWVEPDLAAFVDGDATPIEDYSGVPRLQATSAARDGVVIPSGMVLEYLRTHQGTDSLRHELNQFDQQWMVQQVVEYVAQNGNMVGVSNRSSPNATDVRATIQSVTVEGRANNYGKPHTDPAQQAPSHTVRAAVQMMPTTIRPTTPSARPPVHEEQRRVAATEGEEEDEVVDGEHPIRAVSGPPEDHLHGDPAALSSTQEGKRRRVESGTNAVASSVAPPTPVTPSNDFRGRNFFLNQNVQQPPGSALQDVQYLQRRQQANMATLANAQRGSDTVNESSEGEQRKTPHHAQSSTVAEEGMPATTPYGQVILPTWVVEQRNDTAIRELRQVMGAHNPNDVRLSASGGKRSRIHGSGRESGNSAAWWAEMSSAPMPNYAADPQYSMELF